MSDSWATVVGAIVGASATLAGSGLTHWLAGRRASSLAEKRRTRLKHLLEDQRWIWRSLDLLCSSAGADQAATIELLIEIDARADMKDPSKWALVSRAPWPES